MTFGVSKKTLKLWIEVIWNPKTHAKKVMQVVCHCSKQLFYMGRNLGQSAVYDAGSVPYASTLLGLRSLIVKQPESY